MSCKRRQQVDFRQNTYGGHFTFGAVCYVAFPAVVGARQDRRDAVRQTLDDRRVAVTSYGGVRHARHVGTAED